MRACALLIPLLCACGELPGSLVSPCGDAAFLCTQTMSACGQRSYVGLECRGTEWRCPAGAVRLEADNCGLLGDTSASVVGPAFEDGEVCRLTLGHDSWVEESSVNADFACGGVDDDRPLFDRRFAQFDGLVDLTDAITVDGQTYGFYRRYVFDETQPFGLREDGSGVAPLLHGVFVLPPNTMWPDSDYRSAFWFEGEIYVSQAGGAPIEFQYAANLQRVDPDLLLQASAYELVAQDYLRVGPQHDVQHYPQNGKLVLSTADGFGTEMQFYETQHPDRDWQLALKTSCLLPSGDSESFCDSVRQHPHRINLRPVTSVLVSYRIGSLNAAAVDLKAQQPRAYSSQQTVYLLGDLPPARPHEP